MSAPFEIKPFGQSAVLVSSDRSLVGYQKALATFGRIRAGMNSLLIEGVSPANISEIAELLAKTEPESAASSGRSHTISVTYDGPDLPNAAELSGISVADLVVLHAQVTWTVAMVGFAPGFAYLTTSDTDLFDSIPRLEVPRPKVPAGSLALAAGMSAIYPSATPGGWQLIGRSEVTLFDPLAAQPSLLVAGDTVRFTAS